MGAQTPRCTPGLEKSRRFLESLRDPSARPSIRHCARLAGVSYVTMWKAIRARKTASAPPGPGPMLPELSPHSWRGVKQRIEEDLLQGRLPRRSELPSVKQLCVRYDVAFLTMRKTLDSLCASGVLQRRGRIYRHRQNPLPASRPLRFALLVFNWGPQRQMGLFSDYDNEFVPALETECGHRGVEFEILRFWMEKKSSIICASHGTTPQNIEKRKDIDGYIIPIFHNIILETDIFVRARNTGKPFVIIDEFGGWDVRPCQAGAKHALHLCARNIRRDAEQAGEQIVGRGHRQVAFFSAYHHDLWSQQCLEGLTSALSFAGCPPPAIYVEHGSHTISEYEYTPRAISREVNRKVRDCYGACRRRMPEGYASQLDPLFSSIFDEYLVYAEANHAMQRHLKTCAANKQTTCWVAADADTVRFVSDYLGAHSPGTSLISFGTSRVITQERITTINYNAPAAATAALEFLLYPERKLPGQTGMRLEIQSMMVDRGSLRAI